MNQSKKFKPSDEEEDLFVKYNVPDEILEKIIKFVPSKKSCFLVNKRFHRESIKATRNKCWLNMSRDNLMSSGFENVQWKFSEVKWESNKNVDSSFIIQSKNFFGKHGKKIEKLMMLDVKINKNDLREMLSEMPNLVELRLNWCCVNDELQRVLLSVSSPILNSGTLELKNLKTFSTDGLRAHNSRFADCISCPTIHAIRSAGHEADEEFIRVHNHVKDVELNLYHIPVGHLQKIVEQRHQFDLHRLSLMYYLNDRLTPLHIQLIVSQPHLKSLELQSYASNELLLCIVKLRQLESLEIWIDREPTILNELVCEIIRMPKLTSLKLGLSDGKLFNSLPSIKNEQLQSLELVDFHANDPLLLHIAENFPNLRHLTLEDVREELNFNFLASLKKLESAKFVDIIKHSGTESIVNESVRQLSLPFDLHALIRMMPKTERVVIIESSGSFDDPNEHLQYLKLFFEKVLSLPNLLEIEIKYNHVYLRVSEVIAWIKNRNQSSNLQRITFANRPESSDAMFNIFKDQFPFKRETCTTDNNHKVTFSRF